MTWDQLTLQLGIAGLVITVGYRLALVLINSWTKTEESRTKIWAEGDIARTRAIADGFAQIIGAHGELIEAHHALRNGITALDTKVSVVLDLTPVKGTALPESDPAPTETRKTPVAGVPIPRHRTNG